MDLFKGDVGTGLAVGLGAVVLAPLVGGILRPAAKAVIKGGMTLYRDTGIGDFTGDVVAEARSELDESRREREQREGAGDRTARAKRGTEQPA